MIRQLVHDNKYRKTKIKSYNDIINTNFHCDGVPKEDSHFIFLSLILIDSILNIGKKYYSQAFLEECRFTLKKMK